MNSPAAIPTTTEEIWPEIEMQVDLYIEPGYPAHTSGHPESAYEGRGEVFEIQGYRAWSHRQKKYVPVPAELLEFYDPAQLQKLAREAAERGR